MSLLGRHAVACGIRRALATRAIASHAQTDHDLLTSSINQSEIKRSRAKKTSLFRTEAGVILSRPPIVMRRPTSFEETFYNYQLSLKAKLASPFPEDFYFQRGSIAAKRWQESRSQQMPVVDANAPSVSADDGPQNGKSEGQGARDLNRMPESSVYLLLKSEGECQQWRFPEGSIGINESLHDAAARLLKSHAGTDLNIWNVSRVPVGYMTYEFKTREVGYQGAKVYFTKHRLLAGQVRLQTGYSDFAWVTPAEIESLVEKSYWLATSALLGEK